jgi:hypothetical protein
MKAMFLGAQEFAERMLRLGEKMIAKGSSRAYSRSPQRLAHDQNKQNSG